MTVRALVFSRITTDSQLNTLGFTVSNTFTQHDTDTPNVRPFAVLRWGGTDLGLNDFDTKVGSNLRRLSVWCHDDPGDYERIDQYLSRVRTVLTGLYGTYVGDVGKFVGQITWNGDSDDLNDDVVGTITRNASFTIVGSAA